MKRFSLLILILCIKYSANAQIGGDNTYEFLNLTSSARIASLGGKSNAIKDDDLSLSMENPALINKSVSGQLMFGGAKYYAGINYGDVAYAKDFNKYGTFAAGMHYVNYGTFDRADNTGAITGSFKAADYAFQIGWGKAIDSLFSVGASLKTIYSHLDTYSSFGLALDIGANYFNPKNQVGASIVVKNFGKQLKSYSSGNDEPLPIEIQAGLSVRIKKAPLRFSVVLQHLEKLNMSYSDPVSDNEIDPLTGEAKETKIPFYDKVLRHFIFGGELLIHKSFTLRGGYNFQRRKELGVKTKMSTVGFSWGLGIKIKKFQVNYSRVKYHLEGPVNYLTLNVNIADLLKKKKAAGS